MNKKENKTVKRWMLRSIDIGDNDSLQSTLDEGFEPFSVLTRFIPGKLLDPVNGGSALTPINLMFFKQSYLIPVDENGKEKTITLFKRNSNETEPTKA
jgi:hypothetical protein